MDENAELDEIDKLFGKRKRNINVLSLNHKDISMLLRSVLVKTKIHIMKINPSLSNKYYFITFTFLIINLFNFKY